MWCLVISTDKVVSEEDIDKINNKLDNLEKKMDNINDEYYKKLNIKLNSDIGTIYGFVLGIVVLFFIYNLIF